jgi:RND superfamily putative drug exporter
MRVLGDWNWYLPRWLEWMPRAHRRWSGSREPVPEPTEGR